VQVELQNPWMLAVYVIAMIAICWHFSYGIWLFAAKWGITPGATARKRFGYVCAAFGVVILVIGLASIWAFIEPKYQNAPVDVAPVVSFSVVIRVGFNNNPVILSEAFFSGVEGPAVVLRFLGTQKLERVPDL
jgi:hypothetical protein